jgi:hypothetical protein
MLYLAAIVLVFFFVALACGSLSWLPLFGLDWRKSSNDFKRSVYDAGPVLFVISLISLGIFVLFSLLLAFAVLV